MYSPSYVSLESALSKYGFIPEGVFQIISCTTRKTQSFETPLNSFKYRHLKAELYFGYHLEAWGDYHYAIAEPEKTLIDYLYLHNEVDTIDDISSLRWNADVINDQISLEKLEAYEDYISSAALSRRLNTLKRFLNAYS